MKHHILSFLPRHPDPSGRPNFPAVVQSLSRSDLELLKWSEEDKTAHPEATLLGTELDTATELYTDLQNMYLNPTFTDNRES